MTTEPLEAPAQTEPKTTTKTAVETTDLTKTTAAKPNTRKAAGLPPKERKTPDGKLALDPASARMAAFLLVFPKDLTTNVDIKTQILPTLGWTKNVYGCVKRAALKAGKIERSTDARFRQVTIR